MKLIDAALLTIFLLFSGCQYDPFADDMTTKQPKFKDVTGIYVFEKQTLADKLKDNFINCSIELKPDSSFFATNVPDFSGKIDFHYQGLVSANGKWSITTNGAVANGSGGADPTWGIELNSLPENLRHIDFLGQKPPYKLIVTYGDPDEGAVMIFKKKP